MEIVLETVAVVAVCAQTVAIVALVWRMLPDIHSSSAAAPEQESPPEAREGGGKTRGELMDEGFENIMGYAVKGQTGFSGGDGDAGDG